MKTALPRKSGGKLAVGAGWCIVLSGSTKKFFAAHFA